MSEEPQLKFKPFPAAKPSELTQSELGLWFQAVGRTFDVKTRSPITTGKIRSGQPTYFNDYSTTLGVFRVHALIKFLFRIVFHILGILALMFLVYWFVTNSYTFDLFHFACSLITIGYGACLIVGWFRRQAIKT